MTIYVITSPDGQEFEVQAIHSPDAWMKFISNNKSDKPLNRRDYMVRKKEIRHFLSLALSSDQRRKVHRLGGATWMRTQIDLAQEPK